jgi:hypothetical protein
MSTTSVSVNLCSRNIYLQQINKFVDNALRWTVDENKMVASTAMIRVVARDSSTKTIFTTVWELR